MSQNPEMTEPSLDSEALAERLEDAIGEMRLASIRDFAVSGYDDGTTEDLKTPLQQWASIADQAASLLRRQAEGLRKAEEALSEIARGTVGPERHGHYLAHRAAVKLAREALLKLARKPPNHTENTSIFPQSEIQE